jgi:transmembrane 9 superfamily protein 2/4
MYLYNNRVHGDVFRPPQNGMLLSVLIGNGVQIGIMSLITLSKIIYSIIKCFPCFFYLVFACFGFLSPASRGALMTC